LDIPRRNPRKPFIVVACKLADIRTAYLSYKIYDVCRYINPLYRLTT
jgi:hypothetical protein